MSIDRTNFNALVDDDGSNTVGTLWTKNQVKIVLLDPIDAAIIAPGGQIAFPATQNPSANANTLDDYEEGTWTPVIGGTGGTSGQTYTTQTGRYLKIGRLVYLTFLATLSAKGTITGTVVIQGLPFTVDFYATGELEFSSLATNWVNVIIRAQLGTTTCLVTGSTAAGTSNVVALTTTDISNTTQFIGTVTFLTAN